MPSVDSEVRSSESGKSERRADDHSFSFDTTSRGGQPHALGYRDAGVGTIARVA